MDTQEANRSAPELMLTGVDDKTLGRTRLWLWLMSPVAVMRHAKLSKIEVSAGCL